MANAIIIVDVQKFFLYAAPDNLVSKIVKHIESQDYDVVAFTVFKNEPNSNFVKSLKWPKCSEKEDITLPPEFNSYLNGKNIFSRATYSGFSSTDLDSYLRDNNVHTVTLCGVDTDACVLATAFSAFDLGYEVHVAFDITYSNGELEKEAQAIMKRSLIAKK